jgi:FkbM family methyltransferase
MNSSPIVCFGAGNLGRRVARALHPVLFCDNKPALWHGVVEGIPVESPKVAVERFPEATFVVAIWHPSQTDTMSGRVNQLKALGAATVIPFWSLIAEHRDLLLPNLFWELPDYYAEHRDQINRGRGLLDAEGQAEFDRQMRLRLGDPSDQAITPGPQYFPEDLISLTRNEIFVDCGAYDGDTIKDFRRVSNDQFDKIIAFEPDPQNFLALRPSAYGDPRIKLYPYAVSSRRETLHFEGGGTGARVSSGGVYEVEAIALDEALDGMAPTYIKFDIEGSEPDALEGARRTITTHRPKLAVCAYHAPDHLWKIPLMLNDLLPNSLLTLRAHCADGFDCVCYCIPRQGQSQSDRRDARATTVGILCRCSRFSLPRLDAVSLYNGPLSPGG